MFHVLTLTAFLCCLSAAHPFCPALCTCIFHGGSDGTGIRTVLCNNPDMAEIPVGVPGDTVKLRLEKTTVRRLPRRAFSYLPHLLYLWVSYSAVSVMDAGTLSGLVDLHELRLDGNVLTAFPWEALRDTPRLRALGLRNNQLASVPVEAARYLGAVTFLDLSSNKLTTLPPDLVDTWPPFSGVTEASAQKVVLGLQDNPWFCDCRISKLMELSRMTASPLVLVDPYLVCSGPENLAGVPFQLAVLPQCQKPSVVTSTGRIVSLLGSNVLLRCDATGHPTPALAWARADSLPINATVVQESPGDGVRWSIISLSGVLYKDAGEYLCKAKNVAGSSEASISLFVVGVIATAVSQQHITNKSEVGSDSDNPVWTEPRAMATKPDSSSSSMPLGPLSPRDQLKTLLERKPQQGDSNDKPSMDIKSKKAGNGTSATTIKNIQAIEETSDSVVLLWSTSGVQASAPLTVVYSPYKGKERHAVSTEAGRGRAVLLGLKAHTKYMACVMCGGQARRSQCVTFSTQAAGVGTSPFPPLAVAGMVACALALPLLGLLLFRLLRPFCSSAQGTGEEEDEEHLSQDAYVNLETLVLKQRTLGDQAGELWTRRQTQESERILLCSRASANSLLTFRSDSSRSEYLC